jgi:hypothetical protein
MIKKCLVNINTEIKFLKNYLACLLACLLLFFYYILNFGPAAKAEMDF